VIVDQDAFLRGASGRQAQILLICVNLRDSREHLPRKGRKSKFAKMKSMLPRGSKVIVHEPPVKTRPGVETGVLTSIDPAVLEDSYVYVHCYFDNPGSNTLIRIWKTTFLVDPLSRARSSLVHSENISLAPQWTLIPDGITFSFLLVFSKLPKSCRQFDLKEEIPQPGGFYVRAIQRNDIDVYHINIE